MQCGSRVALAETTSRRGRPRKAIDWVRVKELLSRGCTDVEVARGVGVHPNTLVQGQNAPNYCELKRGAQAGLCLRLRVALLGFAFGLDENGMPVMDAHERPRRMSYIPSERIQFEAAKFLAKQKEYLGWSERGGAPTGGDARDR